MADRSVFAVAPHWRQLAAFEKRCFTERRLRLYGAALLLGSTVAILLAWERGLGEWVVGRDGRLGNIDFCWLWVSGKFAASAAAPWIYDEAIYAAAQHLFHRAGECLFLHQYVYPPTFLFFTYSLGLLPFGIAYAVWNTATLGAYLAAVFAILPRGVALVAALAPAAVLKNLQLGHNGFLIAALLGWGLVLLDKRPWLAGIFIGLLTVKPQFGVLLPVALLASRNWRALGGAAVTVLALAAAAGLAFGWQTWPGFLASLVDRTAGLSPQRGVALSLDSIFGLLHWAGVAAWLAALIQAGAALAAALAVWVMWTRSQPPALKAALLATAVLLVSPYVLRYDLCILSIAVSFLVADGLARGFRNGERTLLVAAFAILYLPLAPLGSIASSVVLFLIVRRMTPVDDLADAEGLGIHIGE